MEFKDYFHSLINGDTKAFGIFAEQYGGFILSSFKSFLHDEEEAKDCSQDLLLKIRQILQKYDPQKGASIKTFLSGAVRYEALHALSRKRIEKKLFQPLPPDEFLIGESFIINDTDPDGKVERIKILISQNISDDNVKAFDLREQKEFDYEQIARIFSCSIKAARTKVSRGKRKIKGLFAKKSAG